MIESDPIHHFATGIYARQQLLPAGHYVETHAHTYDHLSIMSGGPVRVECNGVTIEYSGAACITIKAGVKHKITAEGDAEFFCVHATNETDPMKIESVLVKD